MNEELIKKQKQKSLVSRSLKNLHGDLHNSVTFIRNVAYDNTSKARDYHSLAL